jgi:predicted NBD/HSP70 family sugar kinase
VREESGLTGIPWTVGNDADLAARAECQARARATEEPVADQDFVYVAGHFGLGGAVIRHGVLAAGLHGWGGEIGHAPMDPLGPDCTCGANGCVEQYAGRHIVMRRAGLEPTARTDALLDLLDPGDGPDGADSARIEQAGKAVQVAAGAVGRAAAMAANIVDLDVHPGDARHHQDVPGRQGARRDDHPVNGAATSTPSAARTAPASRR